ncbi:MAG: TolC family protein, partial [Acetobacteraceae bacterium]|nr:TolC family protein [Acetobacteraceae bacterium]
AAQPRERAGTPRPAPAQNQSLAAMPDGSVPVTLSEAVFLALRNNRQIRSQYIQRVQDRFSLRVAQYALEPQASVQGGAFNWNYTRNLGVGPSVFVPLDPRNPGVGFIQRPGGSVSQSITLSATPQASITLPTGAQFTFAWGMYQTLDRTGRGTNSWNSVPTVSVTQPLLRGAGENSPAVVQLRQARLQELQSQINLRGTVAQQVTATIAAYRTLLQAQEQLRISTESLRRARDLVEVTRALVAAGRQAQVEIIQAETRVAQQELSLLSARNALSAARLALLTLLALDPGSPIWAVERPSAETVTVDLNRALSVAQNTRPSLLVAQLGIETARLGVEQARNGRLWDVGVTASAGIPLNERDPERGFGTLPRQRPAYGIGLTFGIPLTDVDRQAAEVSATVALRRAEIAIQEERARLRESVENAVRTIETQRRSAELARRARELAAQQLEAELVRLQAGRSSNFQVVQFQETLQQAEVAELQAVIAYVNALTSLDLELGTTLETWRIVLNDG